MNERPDCIDAAEGRGLLGERGFFTHEPLTTVYSEVFKHETTGKLCSVGYCVPGRTGTFDRRALELTLEQLDKA